MKEYYYPLTAVKSGGTAITHSAAATLGPLLSPMISIQETSTTAERSTSTDAANGWATEGNQESATNDVLPLCKITNDALCISLSITVNMATQTNYL